MEAVGAIFMLLSLTSLAAVIKPFGPYKKRWQAFVGFLVLGVIGGAFFPSPPPSNDSAATVEQPITETQSTSTSTEPPAPSTRWQYSRRRDEMRNANTDLACISSTNELRFDFPYQGGSSAEICFRQSPQHGFDAWVRVEPGQFTCLMDCVVRVKFDDGEIQTFSAAGSSDGSANIVFISNAQRFLTGTQRSARVVVEANFYQAGSHQMVFENAGGLEWPRPD